MKGHILEGERHALPTDIGSRHIVFLPFCTPPFGASSFQRQNRGAPRRTDHLAKTMSPRLLALLATFACSGEGGFVFGSGFHGSRPIVRTADVAGAGEGAAQTDDVASGKIISDERRFRCYGGALSARALCVRARGGSLAEVRCFCIVMSRVCRHSITSPLHFPRRGSIMIVTAFFGDVGPRVYIAFHI